MKYFHTFDIFDNENLQTGIEYFKYCYGKALDCGLICKCILNEHEYPQLELWGTKTQFIKYYFVTLSKCDYKIEGIKRLLKFIFN